MLNFLVIVYVILLLLRPQEFVPFLEQSAILQVLLMLCTGLWVFARHKHLDLPQFRLSAWFVFAALLSVGLAGWWGGIVPRLAGLTPAIMMFLLITSVARELSTLRKIMAIMSACACIMVLHGHWQLANGVGWTGTEPVLGRITYSGLFSDPNDLGQLFVICIAFCVYLFDGARGARKAIIIGAIVWLCYGIYMTDSRGTMLAAMAVFGLEGSRRYGKILVGIFGALAASALAAVTRFGEINAQEEAATDRIGSWYQGTQMFLSHPIFGVGMGNYGVHYELTAHNSITLAMAELGLFGFIPWIGILWFTGRMLHWLAYVPHAPADPERTDAIVIEAETKAAVGLIGVMVGFAVSSFFLSQSYRQLLFLLLGLVTARFAHASSIFKDAPRYSVLAEMPWIVVVAAGAILLMWVITRVLL
jgi:F0F1-type ATP synthase assembly protein I